MMKISKNNTSTDIIEQFPPNHSYYVHDVQYDYYGTRLATCSSDHKIKIWDLLENEDKNMEWKCTEEWKAHDGSIWKLDWAHPEFGQILASCSFDGTVCVWEETHVKEKNVMKRKWIKQKRIDVQNGGGEYGFNKGGNGNSYDSCFCDVKFAPNHFGLKLSTCSLDGKVRIYSAPKVMDLSIWINHSSFMNCEKGSTCLDWNKSIIDEPMIVVGGMDGSLNVWKYSKNNNNTRWILVKELIEKDTGSDNSTIQDVSWAPCMGRTYHLIAAASKNGNLKIWKITRDKKKKKEKKQAETNNNNKDNNKDNNNSRLVSVLMKNSNNGHKGEIWNVKFNITGSILATSGDDGFICLWKYCNKENTWTCIKQVSQN